MAKLVRPYTTYFTVVDPNGRVRLSTVDNAGAVQYAQLLYRSEQGKRCDIFAHDVTPWAEETV